MENKARRDMLGWIAVNQVILSGCGHYLSGRFAKTAAGSSGAAKGAPARQPQRKKAVKASTAARKTPKPPAAVPGRDARRAVFDKSRYTIEEIGDEDLAAIISLYGNSVQDIYELGAGQKWMLEEGSRVKSAFFLQILTKAVIDLNPAAFRQQADEVCEKHESLRSAFVFRDVQQPCRVVLKDRHPEINYFDLSDLSMEEFDEKIEKLMEADRSRGFDLERDPLLRIGVYKSCEKDTYALILSQPHINSDGTSLGILFADLFVGYALDLNGIDKKIEAQSYQAYAEHLQSVDVEKELSYWKRYLGGTEYRVLLPGQRKSELEYKSASLFVPFSEEEIATLKAGQRAMKVTQFTVLQSLWGIMVARLMGSDTVVFGAITSGRDADVSESMKLYGGFVNVLPVKVRFSEDETLAELAKRVQTDFLAAMQHSHCSPGQIQKALGRSEPVFGHILNNHNFSKPKGSSTAGGGIPGIRILGGDTYDNLSADLCVYFTTKDGLSGCNYSYNERAFSGETIQLLSEFFRSMISALGTIGADAKISEFPACDSSLLLAAEEAGRTERLKIAGFMKKHPLFSCAEDDALLSLAAGCSIATYAEDEPIVVKGDSMQDIPVLMQGRAVVYCETRGGWNNPIRVLRRGSVLSRSALFEGMKEETVVTAGEDRTLVLYVPAAEMQRFLEDYPEAAFQMLRELEREKQSYMKLWLNAE